MISKSEIVRGFREFRNEGIHPLVKAYSDDHDQIIGQVFLLIKKSDKIIGDASGGMSRLEFSFPIAKVLQVGRHWRGTGYDEEKKIQTLQPGDLVRLRDNDTKTSLNPAFTAYNKAVNDMKDGNMVPLAKDPPPMYMCNLRDVFGRRVFNPDPFNLEGSFDAWGWDIFFMDQAHITMPILDPEMLINSFSTITLNQN